MKRGGPVQLGFYALALGLGAFGVAAVIDHRKPAPSAAPGAAPKGGGCGCGCDGKAEPEPRMHILPHPAPIFMTP